MSQLDHRRLTFIRALDLITALPAVAPDLKSGASVVATYEVNRSRIPLGQVDHELQPSDYPFDSSRKVKTAHGGIACPPIGLYNLTLSPCLSSLEPLSNLTSFIQVPFALVSQSIALSAAKNVPRQLTYLLKIRRTRFKGKIQDKTDKTRRNAVQPLRERLHQPFIRDEKEPFSSLWMWQ